MDYAYAGWFSLILGYTENGHFPIFFNDSPNQAPEGYMLNANSSNEYIPAPPIQSGRQGRSLPVEINRIVD